MHPEGLAERSEASGLIQHECPVVSVQTKTDFYYTPPLDLSYSSSLTLGQKDDGLVVQSRTSHFWHFITL